jgi:hypothetical protein
MEQPSDFPQINEILHELRANIQAVLGSHLIALYLDGSLTSGDFDTASDIDFVAVTDEDVADGLFVALQAMHDRLAQIDSPWAIQLEGSYISRHAIRRYDPAHILHPNIERGEGERLKMAVHDEAWNIHRYVLRERGITLLGPEPKTLIDPISPEDLRRAMRPMLTGWLPDLLNNPSAISFRGYQCYIVLSICRILYTLHLGAVVSKPTAAHWAQQNLDAQWSPLIESALHGRIHGGDLRPEDLAGTLDFIRYALEFGRQFEFPA